MRAYIFGDWHVWETQGLIFNVVASFEPTKRLHTFNSWNDCINSLFLQGYREEARSLNKALKAAA